MVQAADALARAREGHGLTACVRAHLGLAQYAFMRSDQGNVLEHSEAALDLARRIKDAQLLRRALSIRASMLGESVAFGEAMETFADAVDAANATGDTQQQALVWHNLANTLNAFGAYNDAYDMSRLTLKRLGRFDPSERNTRLHWSAQAIMATALFHMQEPSRSLQVIRQGLERMPEPRDASEFLAAAELHQQYVYLLLEVESVSRAEDHAQQARALADQCGYPRARLAADLAGAMVSVHKGPMRDGIFVGAACQVLQARTERRPRVSVGA
jgi:tetratricopeptide (TPR) repeat protein